MTTPTTAYEAARALNLPPELGLDNPDWVAKVQGFHNLFAVPIGDLQQGRDPAFNHMDNARVEFRLGLVIEEVKELFKDGFGIDLVINYTVQDSLQSDPWQKFQFPESQLRQALDRAEHEGYHRNGVETADASGDIVYVLIGMMLEKGYDLRRVITEIHASNLTKLGADGKPIYREDGKVLKGPNYVKPNIRAALGLTGDDE
jgi:predicted HAD superfamily Cof-like phosphohydrolase